MAIRVLKPDPVADSIVGSPVELEVEEPQAVGTKVEIHLNVPVQAVEVADKGIEGVSAMVPDEKNVILEPQPQLGSKCGRAEGRQLPVSHVNVGKRAAKGLPHLHSRDLDEAAAVENEVVVSEAKPQNLQHLQIGPVGIGVRSESVSHSTKALLDWHIGVEGADVEGAK